MSAPIKKISEQFKSAPRYSQNPPPERVFRFLRDECATSVPTKYVTYRPPKLVKGNKRWYVEYYYKVPSELRAQYKDRDFWRFRVFEQINFYNGKQQEEYAEKLLKAVEEALANGYSPFEDKQLDLAMFEGETEVVTIKKGLEMFLEKNQGKGLDPNTITKYETAAEIVRTYFVERNLLSQPISKVKKAHIIDMLDRHKLSEGYGNRQYNNRKSQIYTIFEFIKGSEIILHNPVAGIQSLKQKAKKHKFYDKNLFPKVTAAIKENEPYLWYAVQFVYYLCVRSEKELAALKVRGIQDDYFFFTDTKSNREELIPIDVNLKEVMKEMGLDKASPDDYIFSASGKPSSKPFGKNFFSRRFANIRKLTGLSSEYTLYGFKHTRAVHLVKDGVNIADIMKLMRHTNIGATLSYLRGLGVDFNPEDLQAKSRKI